MVRAQPGGQGVLIQFALRFEDKDFIHACCLKVVTIQSQEQSRNDIGGSLFTVDKTAIAGKTETVCGGQIEYVRAAIQQEI